MKKLIAYSSIAHMGFVTLGFFIIFRIAANGSGASIDSVVLALEGGAVQMISHGFISAAMFLCVGVLYDRMHSREISAYGGVANRMPVFAGFFVLFAMANAGLPGTSGFVGEFMVILASFQAGFWYAAIAALTLILGAAYTLWMIKRVVYGEVANREVAELEDVDRREWLVLGLLALAVLALGLWPAPLIEVMEPSLQNLAQHVLAAAG
jgi:NADH-quinone oxidoreductase subunit M